MWVKLAIGMFIILGLVSLVRRSLPTRYQRESLDECGRPPKASVQILVLGDIGHSPRMQYHAMSIAKHGGQVCIIGYRSKLLSFYKPPNTG